MHFSTLHLHIPDSYLSFVVAVIFWAITVLTLSVAIRRTNQTLGERQIPLMGIMAAFIFAAQMINFPVAGGTSGHLLGGALAAMVLGPWPAMLAMTAVIAVQGLLFQDGGLTAMGANIFNMGILTAAIGFGLYRGVATRSRGTKLIVAGVAAWLSVMAGALSTSLELWLSGSARLELVVPPMLFIHALIGLGEAAITVAALSFILRTRPDLLTDSPESPRGGRGWVAAGVLLSLTVVLLAPFASTNPDGLTRIAIDLGLVSATSVPLTGYSIPTIASGPWSRIAAGVLGLLVVLAVSLGIGRAARAKS